MVDLTSGNLIAYIRRVIEDAVGRNRRFRDTLGQVTHAYSNMIQWRDAQVSIRDVADAGNRLSPDYFLCKTYGRAILAKIENHEGQFIEWVQEMDPTMATPPPGVYYLNVDSVSDKTNDVELTMHTYRWVNGKVRNAAGSLVYLAPGIDGTALSASIAGSPVVRLTTAVNDGGVPPPVDVLLSPHVLYLLTPTPAGLQLFDGPTQLVPMQDYWYQQERDVTLVQGMADRPEIAYIPQPFVSFSLADQTGYALKPGVDYNWYASNTWVELTQNNPVGTTVIAKVVAKVDPMEVPGTNPENVLQVGLKAGETLASGQVVIRTTAQVWSAATPNPDGTVTLQRLLMPGESLNWSMRVDSGQRNGIPAKKWYLNEEVIPGLRLAMGDNVSKGDQVAVIVSPAQCETYEVYGSKENIDMTLEVRANDLQTASDLSELLKEQLLVMRRTGMESDGVTIFEARRTYRGTQRDQSGTAPQYVYDMAVSAMADWKVYVPLVTWLAHLEIANAPSITPNRLVAAPRAKAFGNTAFLQSYT